MSKSKFFEILSTILGFSGSLIIAIGIICQTPEFIAKYQGMYFGRNPFMLESLAQQKADTTTGFILILIAFLVHLLKLVFLKDETKKLNLGHYKVLFWH